MPAPYRSVAMWVATALGAAVLAACSSSVSGQPDKSTASDSTTPATQQASSSSANAMSKTEFVSAANALCHTVAGQIAALPTPSGAGDYAALITYVQAAKALFPPWLAHEKALVAQSADKDELTAKWISLEEADYNAQKPLLDQLLTAAQAKQSAEVGRLGGELDKAASHTDEISAYLTTYGLADCAKLESS